MAKKTAAGTRTAKKKAAPKGTTRTRRRTPAPAAPPNSLLTFLSGHKRLVTAASAAIAAACVGGMALYASGDGEEVYEGNMGELAVRSIEGDKCIGSPFAYHTADFPGVFNERNLMHVHDPRTDTSYTFIDSQDEVPLDVRSAHPNHLGLRVEGFIVEQGGLTQTYSASNPEDRDVLRKVSGVYCALRGREREARMAGLSGEELPVYDLLEELSDYINGLDAPTPAPAGPALPAPSGTSI
jgi:hypothetical protein